MTEHWNVRAHDAPHQPIRPPHRPIPVTGLDGYLEPIGVRPGEPLRIHLSAPAAHRIEVARLGREAILRGDDAADRAEATVLGTLEAERASRHDVHPGAYAYVDDETLARPAAISTWIRLWRPPSTSEVWNFAVVVGDFDHPSGCHWALAIDDNGRPGCYVGGGGQHDAECWTWAGGSLADRAGEWVHLACTIEGDVVRLWVDALVVAEGRAPAAAPSSGRVRIAAGAESGLADHLLDADLSDMMLLSRPLRRRELIPLVEERTLRRPHEHGISDADLLAYWPMREVSGAVIADASGHGRDAAIVNQAILSLPGPAAASSSGQPGYDPTTDPTRGGSIRFCSDELIDCDWPIAAEVTIPDDADSGTYCVRVTLAGADEALELPFVVVRPTPRREGSVALLYATYTWAAYGRRPYDDVLVPGLASSFYSSNLGGKMFYNVGFRLPLPRAKPFAHPTHRVAETLHQHLVRPERLAEAWLAAEGYAYECVTDAELTAEPELLSRFSALMIVGHNEYWSQEMRDGIEAYLDGGGDVLCLSGNTAFWRVTHHRDANWLEGRKTSGKGTTLGDLIPPSAWGERWHTDGRPGGAWEHVGQPPWELIGVNTLGWIDSGDATAYAPFGISEPDHFLFNEPERVPLEDGGRLGSRSVNGGAVSGYEMDGLPEAFGHAFATPPEGLVRLGHAEHGRRYVAFLGDEPGYGADLLYWERAGGGRLFNGASIAYTGSLPADEGIAALTRNVLHHFGVARDAGGSTS